MTNPFSILSLFYYLLFDLILFFNHVHIYINCENGCNINMKKMCQYVGSLKQLVCKCEDFFCNEQDKILE
jgi:hypothetical protein